MTRHIALICFSALAVFALFPNAANSQMRLRSQCLTSSTGAPHRGACHRSLIRWRVDRCCQSCVCCATSLEKGQQQDVEPQWQSLFDGKSLEGWEPSVFGGEGAVTVEDGLIQLQMGVTLTGITFQNDVPRSNYEVSLDAKIVDGIDFFCGLTFPVGEEHCSFIVGGWAGSIVGLSNIDGMDASENETTTIMTFDQDRWYNIRVRVEDDRIQCWIDDERIVDQSIEGRKISIRPEVDLSCPFGIASFQTTAALRNIKIRKLREE